MNHEIDTVSHFLDLVHLIAGVCGAPTDLHAARIVRVDLLAADNASSATNGYKRPLLVYNAALGSDTSLLRDDRAAAPWGNLSLPRETGNRVLRGLRRLLQLLDAFRGVITDRLLGGLLLALGGVHVALLLHTPRRALFHVLLDLLDRRLLKHIPHHIEVAQVLPQLVLANVYELLLGDAVSAHVPLNRGRMEVFVLLNDRDDV